MATGRATHVADSRQVSSDRAAQATFAGEPNLSSYETLDLHGEDLFHNYPLESPADYPLEPYVPEYQRIPAPAPAFTKWSGPGCPPWGTAHDCNGIFAEYLLLRPRNFDVTYASEVNGPNDAPPPQGVQMGPMGVVNGDYSSGYRVGYSRYLNSNNQIRFTYTDFNSRNLDSLSKTAGTDFVVRSLVTHPLGENAASDWDAASASLDVDFQFADVDYLWHLSCAPNYTLDALVGVRWGQLNQEFQSQFTSLGFRNVNTDIDFDSGGIRFGLDFERRAACSGFRVHGRSHVSFLLGDFKAAYLQSSDADPIEVQTDWESTQVVTVLDFELGAGWQSCGGRLRIDAGYLVSFWFNTVTTDEFISAVQLNDFDQISETVMFDGFAVRGEFRF